MYIIAHQSERIYRVACIQTLFVLERKVEEQNKLTSMFEEGSGEVGLEVASRRCGPSPVALICSLFSDYNTP